MASVAVFSGPGSSTAASVGGFRGLGLGVWGSGFRV